jgi:hypothetical protein
VKALERFGAAIDAAMPWAAVVIAGLMALAVLR